VRDMDAVSYGIHTPATSSMGVSSLLLLFGGMFIFLLVFVIAVYVYFAFCLMKMAQKTNTENAWMAWIPIANLVLMIQIARKPMWWLALFLLPIIPVVGAIATLIIVVILWMEIAGRLGKEKWLGILMIVPIANLILPGYLAFSKSEPKISQGETTEGEK